MQAPRFIRRSAVIPFVLFLVTPLVAQDNHHFNVSAGAGFSSPLADASGNLNTGWNVAFRGGVNVSPNLLADLDFTYNRWDLTNAALADFGEPNGYADVWSITFTPVIRFSPHSRFDPYILAGYGLYHRGLTLTRPANVNTIFCDPFFGFCFPATVSVDQVVASFSTYKAGFNAGGGFEFGIGQHGLKAFAEARYNDMFTTRGPDLEFVPVTFGIRW